MINTMATAREIQVMAFITKLNETRISCYPDTERRPDGKLLENYVFEKDGKTVKIIFAIINKEFGLSVSDADYYTMLIQSITNSLK